MRGTEGVYRHAKSPADSCTLLTGRDPPYVAMADASPIPCEAPVFGIGRADAPRSRAAGNIRAIKRGKQGHSAADIGDLFPGFRVETFSETGGCVLTPLSFVISRSEVRILSPAFSNNNLRQFSFDRRRNILVYVSNSLGIVSSEAWTSRRQGRDNTFSLHGSWLNRPE